MVLQLCFRLQTLGKNGPPYLRARMRAVQGWADGVRFARFMRSLALKVPSTADKKARRTMSAGFKCKRFDPERSGRGQDDLVDHVDDTV